MSAPLHVQRAARAVAGAAARGAWTVVEALHGVTAALRSNSTSTSSSSSTGTGTAGVLHAGASAVAGSADHDSAGQVPPRLATVDVSYESKFTRSVFYLLGTAVSVAVAITWSDALHNLTTSFRGETWDLPIFVAFAMAVSVVAVSMATAAAFSIEQRRQLGQPLNITRLRMLALTSSAFGICVGWAWFDVITVMFHMLVPSVRTNIVVSLLFALLLTAGGTIAVAWTTRAMDASRSHLIRQLFVLVSNAVALIVGFTWQNTLTVAVEHLSAIGSTTSLLLRLSIVGGVYWLGIVLRRGMRTLLDAALADVADDAVRRQRKSYGTLLARMLGLLLGLAMSDALHELFLKENGKIKLHDVMALLAYSLSTVVIAITAAWWFSAKPDAKAIYSKDARALAISCAGFLMGWAVKDVAHAFFVQYLTTAYPGQVAGYLVFAVCVTVGASLLLKATLVPVDFRDDWYEYDLPEDDAAGSASAVFAPDAAPDDAATFAMPSAVPLAEDPGRSMLPSLRPSGAAAVAGSAASVATNV